jgi:hypothetical protein
LIRHSDFCGFEKRIRSTIATPEGKIRIKLYPDEAPITVANFINEPGFVIQGGIKSSALPEFLLALSR